MVARVIAVIWLTHLHRSLGLCLHTVVAFRWPVVTSTHGCPCTPTRVRARDELEQHDAHDRARRAVANSGRGGWAKRRMHMLAHADMSHRGDKGEWSGQEHAGAHRHDRLRARACSWWEGAGAGAGEGEGEGEAP